MSARLLTPKKSKKSGIEKPVHMPPRFNLRRFYTPKDVAAHNTANDCWVSFYYEVYDLTKLIQKNYNALVEPIIKAAGTDISHWFNPKTKEPITMMGPSCTIEYYTPLGRYLHLPPLEPDSTWINNFKTPWWRNKKYSIGKLTKKVRKIRIINMISKQDDIIEVCSEETINEILDRYLVINSHAASYTWKRLGKPLDMERTLTDNNIPDESEEFAELNIDEDEYIPAIHLYYNDDLTVA